MSCKIQDEGSAVNWAELAQDLAQSEAFLLKTVCFMIG
jgi:hypothetical protein